MKPGKLFVVATPIGNLGDISHRALQVLGSVQLVAAEDTRHSQRLLSHYGINVKLSSLHEHNEESKSPVLVERMVQGDDIALVSDAGTPLISDPGRRLIKAAITADIKVIPVPGACAAIAALSASGLSSDSFLFIGFLPARGARRRKRLAQLKFATPTLIFYEAVHRIEDFLQDIVEVFGEDRQAVVARELTKQFESFQRGSLQELKMHYQHHADQVRGEFVVLVEGVSSEVSQMTLDAEKVLQHLLEVLSPAKAAATASKITGEAKSSLYELAMKLKSN